MATPSSPTTPGPPAGAPAVGRAAVVVAAVVAVLTVLFAASFGPWSDGQVVGNDAIHYAAAVTAGDARGLALANHLACHPLAFGVHRAGAALGLLEGYAGALVAQRIVSALGGALAVALVWRLVLALGAPRRVAGLAALALATSSGLWLYASVGETYAPAAAAEAWVLIEAWRARDRRAGWGRLAAALAIATLVRQDAVLVAVVVPVVLGGRGLVPLVVAGAASLAVHALVFAGTAVPVNGAEPSFVDWLTGIAATETWGAGAARPSAAVAVGVHGVLTLDALAFGVHRVHAWSAAGVASFGALALYLAALVRGLRGSARDADASTRTDASTSTNTNTSTSTNTNASASANTHATNDATAHRRFALALAAFLALRFAFFSWFQPSNIEYAVGHLVPLVVLFALAWSRAHGAARLAAGAVAVQTVATLLLVVPLTERRLDADARALTGRAREAGHLLRIVTVEPFGELALARERYRTGDPRDPRRLVSFGRDGSDLPDPLPKIPLVVWPLDGSGGHDPARANEVATTVGSDLANGRDVVVVIDRRIAPTLGLARAEVPTPLATALVALTDFETLATSGGLAAYLLPGADAPTNE